MTQHIIEDYQKRIARLEADNELLGEEVARMERRIVELNNEGYSKDKKIRSLEWEFTDLEDKVSSLERDLDSARNQAEYDKNQAYQEGYQNGQGSASRSWY